MRLRDETQLKCVCCSFAVPGEQSCKHGWHLHKKANACYMHSDRTVNKSWSDAQTYCSASKAQLALPYNADDLTFLSKLADISIRNSSFWLDPVLGAHRNHSWRTGFSGQASRCSVFDKTKEILSSAVCSKKLPFICQRGEQQSRFSYNKPVDFLLLQLL